MNKLDEILKVRDQLMHEFNQYASKFYVQMQDMVAQDHFTDQEIKVLIGLLQTNINTEMNYKIASALFWKGK